MEVYEVMLFAVPLWFGMVGFIFLLVFGMDIIAYFKSKRSPKSDWSASSSARCEDERRLLARLSVAQREPTVANANWSSSEPLEKVEGRMLRVQAVVSSRLF